MQDWLDDINEVRVCVCVYVCVLLVRVVCFGTNVWAAHARMGGCTHAQVLFWNRLPKRLDSIDFAPE